LYRCENSQAEKEKDKNIEVYFNVCSTNEYEIEISAAGYLNNTHNKENQGQATYFTMRIDVFRNCTNVVRLYSQNFGKLICILFSSHRPHLYVIDSRLIHDIKKDEMYVQRNKVARSLIYFAVETQKKCFFSACC
jgi:hypothetical protein